MRLGDAALLVDDVGDSLRILVIWRGGGAVRKTDFPVGVAEEWEGEVEFPGEAGVGVDVIETGAEDGGVLRFVVVDEVPEPGTLGRSARCVGLRIKPEHDLAATQIVKRDRASVMVLHFKVRSLVANIQHASSSQ